MRSTHVGVAIEEHAVLLNQDNDVHSHGQVTLTDKAEYLHTHSSSLWHGWTLKSSFIFRLSFRVDDSLSLKYIHRSKPLAAWASEWLDYHHAEAQLHIQIFTVRLTPPHAEFKEAGDYYDICMHVHMHCKTQHTIFCSSWEKLFLYLQKGRFRRPRSAQAGDVAPAASSSPAASLCSDSSGALGLPCHQHSQSARHWKSIMQFYSPWGTSSSICAIEQAQQIGRQRRRQHCILHRFLSLISCGMMAALSLLMLFRL